MYFGIILESMSEVSTGLDALFAALIGFGIVAINQITQWILRKKPLEKIRGHAEEVKISIESLAKDVTEIKKEIQTNGGTTIKDVVSKMDSSLTTIEVKLDKVIAQARGRTELALNQSSVAQFLCNENGEITFANDAMVDLFGMNRPHLLKHKYLSVIDSQDVREEIIRRMGFAISKQITFSMNDIPLRSPKTNELKKIRMIVSPTLDDNENFMWFIGKITEYTDSKEIKT